MRVSSLEAGFLSGCSVEVFDQHYAAGCAVDLSVENRAPIRRDRQARRTVQEWLINYGHLRYFAGCEAEEVYRRTGLFCFRNEIDPGIGQAPVAVIPDPKQLRQKRFFAALRRHPPDARYFAVLGVINKLAVG